MVATPFERTFRMSSRAAAPLPRVAQIDYLPLEQDSQLGVTWANYGLEAARAWTNAPMTVTSPPGLVRRRLKQYQRRALTLLAGCGSAGCHEEVMRAHGFRADELATMVRIGFVAKTTERVAGGVGQTFEVERFKITEEGERALG